ncbi:MAG TPA: bifunctional folylpolyglutamate synthase/dihydrofolate synthase [Caldithrix abyssi]|uniref:Dihydrofolate synthase/folylpolyglutamate synthase n=1 Tax=Caldithrix abyssi TaxID=187145 RepID=A0A7V1LJR6_CALAY|nr:bifunctional folylpolyglutamate synthase/dihydrofolate synthase [Caldithrix abyssi]
MTPYSQTVEELFDLQKYAIKLGLDNITALARVLDHPEKKYPVIHVAGTNGKGSTCLYLAQILRAHGFKTGLFTSPHLVDFRERIRVDEKLIPREDVIDFWQRLKKTVLELKATFFDTTTAMALDHFARSNVDVVVMETGLGGRLDSTNIVPAEMAVITPIGFDHQKQLGNTLAGIAGEKAGIIKTAIPVFTGRQPREAMDVLRQTCRRQKSFLHTVAEETRIEYHPGRKGDFQMKSAGIHIAGRLPQPGRFQLENLALALNTARFFMKQRGQALEAEKVERRLPQMRWPGRLELVRRKPDVFFDVSHNLPGIKASMEVLSEEATTGKRYLLLGLVNDKDMSRIVRYLSSLFEFIVVTEPQSSRRQEGELLYQAFLQHTQNVKLIKDLVLAYESSLSMLGKNDTLVVMGSHYLVGALKARVDKKQQLR